jgi:hypothetical protein
MIGVMSRNNRERPLPPAAGEKRPKVGVGRRRGPHLPFSVTDPPFLPVLLGLGGADVRLPRTVLLPPQLALCFGLGGADLLLPLPLPLQARSFFLLAFLCALLGETHAVL